jgi:hypothetical protein
MIYMGGVAGHCCHLRRPHTSHKRRGSIELCSYWFASKCKNYVDEIIIHDSCSHPNAIALGYLEGKPNSIP